MTIREIRKFRFVCDGWYPDGHGVCGCRMDIEAENQDQAINQALAYGWKQSVTGTAKDPHVAWICNAGGGHR